MLKNVFKVFSKLIFNNKCLLCNKNNTFAYSICFSCLKSLKYFNYKGKCPICLDILQPNNSCKKCNTKPFSFKKAFTCLVYNNKNTSKLIKDYKYKDKLILKNLFITLLNKTAKKQLYNIKIDLVCPVPLHYFRLLTRRYNQSSLLAKGLAKNLNKNYIYNLVIKTRPTKNQSSLTKNSRELNLKKVFKINKKFAKTIVNKNILLVDDVVTTGTTVNEIAKQLIKAGAKNIYIISIAKSLNKY